MHNDNEAEVCDGCLEPFDPNELKVDSMGNLLCPTCQDEYDGGEVDDLDEWDEDDV